MRELRDATGLRIKTHVSQSRTEVNLIRDRDGMSPVDLLDEVGLLDDRLIAAHGIHLTESDIARLAAARVNVAHIAKGNQTHGCTGPTHVLLSAGARLTLSTDNMHADMVELMRWALATGRLQQQGIIADWQPSRVFEAATMGGARALGLGHEIGSIETSKRADLVIFDFRRAHLRPMTNVLGDTGAHGTGA